MNRQMKLYDITKDWKDGITCVVDHGANPGMISHFARQGLFDIAKRMIDDDIAPDPRRMKILMQEYKFGELAKEVGVKVIHCSERDTQISDVPKKVDEFVGTWCVEGLREEGIAPAEIGWGIHEKELPNNSHLPPIGPMNEIFIDKMGINTWVRSWVPHQEIVGMVIRHGESFGISHRWSVWDGDKLLYRPTVNYAYLPCDATMSSLHELRGRNYHLQPNIRILHDENIIHGSDILGALLMGHPYKSWWAGSILSIEESRELVPNQNATTIQVAIGVVSALLWMIENPREGFCLPDDIPHDFILNIAMPYLGSFVSTPSDWTPLKDRDMYFKVNDIYDKSDVWQFKNFLFQQ